MGQETHLLFIDFSKTYDKVQHNLLFEKMSRMNIDNEIILFPKEIYRKNESCVRYDGKLSEGFPRSIGVKQGCPAFPPLFNIFMSDLLGNMSGVYCNNEEVKGLLFADDAVIISESIESMEATVRSLEVRCDKNKMQLNIEKYGYMIVNGNTEGTLSINGHLFLCVAEYTYLGLPFTQSMNIMRIISDRRDKVNRALFSMQNFLCKKYIMWPLKIKLVKSVLISIATYGTELYDMAADRVKPLQQVVDKALKMTCLVGAGTNLQSLYKKLRVFTIEERSDRLRRRALLKWKHSKTYISGLIRRPAILRKSTWVT